MQGLVIPENPFHIKKFSYGYRFSNKTPAILKNPGVGDYNIRDDHPSSPIIKFPKSLRHDVTKEKLFLPGPGTYHIDSPMGINSKKLSTMKSSFLDFSSQNDSLSPLAKRRNSKSVINENQSEISTKKKKTLRRVISQSQSQTKLANLMSSPGPGAYNVSEAEAYLIKQPNVVFGTSEKQPDPIIDGLYGPTYYSYNRSDIIGKGSPHHSFIKSKKFPEPRENFPGPTKYDTLSTKITTRSVVKVGFGKGRRGNNIIKENNIPGPGQYQPNNTTFEKGITMSKTTRPPNLNSEAYLPGPGSYQIEDELTIKKREANKKNVLKKLLAKAKSLSGTFDISSLNVSQMTSEEGSLLAGYSKSNFIRDLPPIPLEQNPVKKTWVDSLIYHCSSPGPVYNIINNTLEVSNKGTKFPIDIRQPINYTELKKNNPGPGDYNDNFKESYKGEYSFFRSRRSSVVSSTKTPGPGRYEILVQDSINGGAIGKAQRRIANYD